MLAILCLFLIPQAEAPRTFDPMNPDRLLEENSLKLVGDNLVWISPAEARSLPRAYWRQRRYQ